MKEEFWILKTSDGRLYAFPVDGGEGDEIVILHRHPTDELIRVAKRIERPENDELCECVPDTICHRCGGIIV